MIDKIMLRGRMWGLGWNPNVPPLSAYRFSDRAEASSGAAMAAMGRK